MKTIIEKKWYLISDNYPYVVNYKIVFSLKEIICIKNHIERKYKAIGFRDEWNFLYNENNRSFFDHPIGGEVCLSEGSQVLFVDDKDVRDHPYLENMYWNGGDERTERPIYLSPSLLSFGVEYRSNEKESVESFLKYLKGCEEKIGLMLEFYEGFEIDPGESGYVGWA